jgi:flagellar hook assembly protein FlgD
MVENILADIPGGAMPIAFALRQNRPNPFGASTTIGFDLPEHTSITIEVIDIEGRVIATLLDETREAGRHSASWDGRDASGSEVGPGIYFIRMTAGGFNATRKAMLLK